MCMILYEIHLQFAVSCVIKPRVTLNQSMTRIVRFLKCLIFLFQLLQDKCVHPFSLASVPCLNNRVTATTATITFRGRLASSHRALQLQSNRNEYETEVLSHDPKCYLIHNFLSSEECQAYISKLSEVSPERIKQSNAPKVSLDIENFGICLFFAWERGYLLSFDYCRKKKHLSHHRQTLWQVMLLLLLLLLLLYHQPT
jgi:hypothetical protein